MPLSLSKLQTPGTKSLAFDSEWMNQISSTRNATVLQYWDCTTVNFTITPIISYDRIEYKVTWDEVPTEPGETGATDGSDGARGADGAPGIGGGGGDDGGDHTHTIADIEGLQGALDGKASSSDLEALTTRVTTLESKVAALEALLEGYTGVDYELCDPSETKTFLVK